MALSYIGVVNGDTGMALNYIDGNGLHWMLSMVNPRDDNVSLGLDYRGISVLC